MKNIISIILVVFVNCNAYAFCEVRNLFPLFSQSNVTETSSGETGGPAYTFSCPGSKMEIVKSSSTFQIRKIEMSNCGEDGLTLTPIYTATIHFDLKSAFYYDLKNNRHELDVQCTDDEMFIILKDRPVTWIDPWKPGLQKWRIRSVNKQVLVDYTKEYPDSFLELKSTFNTPE